MSIIERATKILFNRADAQAVTMCYATAIPQEQVNTIDMVGWATAFIASPLAAFIIALRSALQLRRRTFFSVHYAIGKAFPRIVIVLLIGTIAVVAINSLNNKGDAWGVDPTEAHYDWALPLLDWEVNTILFVMYSGIFLLTGLGFLLFTGMNKKFGIVAACFLLIAPSIYIIGRILLCNTIPSWRRFLPEDAIFGKRKKLQERLSQNSKLPPDTGQKA